MRDMELILVENFPCNSRDEAKARERFWIEQYGTLNMTIPNRTNKEWYEKNKIKTHISCQKWCAENREKLQAIKREWYEKNKEVIAEKTKVYQAQHKEDIAKYNKEWREKNNEELMRKAKQYRLDNAERIKAKDKAYNLKNKEHRSEKIPCDTCGTILSRGSMNAHCKAKHPE